MLMVPIGQFYHSSHVLIFVYVNAGSKWPYLAGPQKKPTEYKRTCKCYYDPHAKLIKTVKKLSTQTPFTVYWKKFKPIIRSIFTG